MLIPRVPGRQRSTRATRSLSAAQQGRGKYNIHYALNNMKARQILIKVSNEKMLYKISMNRFSHMMYIVPGILRR